MIRQLLDRYGERVGSGETHILDLPRLVSDYGEKGDELQIPLVSGNLLRLHGLSYHFNDLVTGQAISAEEDLRLEPHAFICLEQDGYRA